MVVPASFPTCREDCNSSDFFVVTVPSGALTISALESKPRCEDSACARISAALPWISLRAVEGGGVSGTDGLALPNADTRLD